MEELVMPKITIGKVRTILYETAKILGDYSAIKRGTVGHRLYNRILGRMLGKLFK